MHILFSYFETFVPDSEYSYSSYLPGSSKYLSVPFVIFSCVSGSVTVLSVTAVQFPFSYFTAFIVPSGSWNARSKPPPILLICRSLVYSGGVGKYFSASTGSKFSANKLSISPVSHVRQELKVLFESSFNFVKSILRGASMSSSFLLSFSPSAASNWVRSFLLMLNSFDIADTKDSPYFLLYNSNTSAIFSGVILSRFSANVAEVPSPLTSL